MTNIAKSLVFVLMIAVLSPTTFAASTTIDNISISGSGTNGIRTVTGTTSAGAEKEVTILATAKDIDKTIVYINQVTSGTGGSYSFDFKMPSTAVAGIYDLKVGGTEVDIPSPTTFSYGSFAVNTSADANGSISPLSPSVDCGATQTFTITPVSRYQIDKVYFNNVEVFATNINPTTNVGTYTTPAIEAVSTLNVTFKLRTLVVPDISADVPTVKTKNSFTFKKRNVEGDITKTFEKSAISYATITSPNDYPIVEYGMILKDKTQGTTRKDIVLPVPKTATPGQFAVQIFGKSTTTDDEDTTNAVFTPGAYYSLTPYVKYTDSDDENKEKIKLGEEKTFMWN